MLLMARWMATARAPSTTTSPGGECMWSPTSLVLCSEEAQARSRVLWHGSAFTYMQPSELCTVIPPLLLRAVKLGDKPASVAGFTITLAYELKNVQIRVGNTQPWPGRTPIQTGNTLCYSSSLLQAGTTTVWCTAPSTGLYASIQLMDDNAPLIVCEVSVVAATSGAIAHRRLSAECSLS